MDNIEQGMEKLDRVRQRISHLRRDVIRMQRLSRSVTREDGTRKESQQPRAEYAFGNGQVDQMSSGA